MKFRVRVRQPHRAWRAFLELFSWAINVESFQRNKKRLSCSLERIRVVQGRQKIVQFRRAETSERKRKRLALEKKVKNRCLEQMICPLIITSANNISSACVFHSFKFKTKGRTKLNGQIFQKGRKNWIVFD